MSPTVFQCECPVISDSEYRSVCQAVTTVSAGAGAVGESSTAIGATLGAVAAVLLLILMGVVTGWVWTCQCYRKTLTAMQK